MAQVETKAWYQSKTVMGSLAAIVLSILGMLGKDIGITEGELTDILVQIGAIVGMVLALIGRFTAKKDIE